MVGVNDAGVGTAENPRQAQDLQGSKNWNGLQGGGLRGERGGLGTRGADFPTKIDQSPGEGEGLGVRASTPETGIEMDDASG